MKRKKLLFAACFSAVAAGALGLAACGDDGIVFQIDGAALPETIGAELGDLFIMPKVVAVKDGREFEVEISVLDSRDQEVELINKKFRATDADGYTLVFTATDGEESDSARVSVLVTDTKAPTFSFKEVSGFVSILGEEVTVPECTVIDASSDALTATYTVKDSAGNEVSVENGKFTTSVTGDYTITYTATDPSGNIGTKDFIVSCKKAVVLNGFEEAADLGWVQFDVAAKDAVSEPARNGNAVRVELADPQSSDGNWRRICVPFRAENGEFLSWEEVQKFEGIQCYIYSSEANEIGLTTFVRPIEAGWNTVYYTMEEIAAAYNIDPSQYSPDENGFFLNLKFALPGSYLVFDYMLGIYADDYVPDAEFLLEDGSDLPEELRAELNGSFAVPQANALRDGKEMSVTVKVTDSAGTEVALTDGAFVISDPDGYTIAYTATDEQGSQTVLVQVVVIDTRVPQIDMRATGNLAVVGEVFRIPESVVTIITGENLTAEVSVTDPDGNAVEVKDGMFTPEKEGEYTVVYTAFSPETGNSNEAEFIVYCTEGKILNSFLETTDVSYVGYDHSAERISADGVYGIKVTSTAVEAKQWATIYLPLKDPDGNFLTWEDVSEFERVDIYVFISENMGLGLCNGVKDYPQGKAVISFTAAELAAAYQADPTQYREDGTGFYFNIRQVNSGAYIVFENFVGVYPEGYAPKVLMTLADGGELPENIRATQSEIVTVPDVKAVRKGSSEEMQVTVKVTDSAGAEVTLTDGAFVAADLGGYTITYKATDESGSEERSVSVAVADPRVPVIEVNSGEQTEVYRGDLVTIPDHRVIFGEDESLKADISVSDPDGETVVVSENAFIAEKPGTYKVVYSVTAPNGNADREEISFVCINGKLLSGFDAINCVEWTAVGNTKQLTEDGLQMTWTASGSWVRVCVPLRKADGTFMTWDEIMTFDRIEITLTVSEENGVGLISGDSIRTLAAGTHTLVFTKAELEKEMQASADLYAPNENGLYITVRTATPGASLTFRSIVGCYAEEESVTEITLAEGKKYIAE